nr:ROK family transcriptional regulator [Leifsonia psychrotolerans]
MPESGLFSGREARLAAPTTSTLSLVNQTSILEVLRASGPMSRQALVAQTGLSSATVNRLTAALIADRYVMQDGVAPSTGGRPSIVLRYTGAYRVIVAVKVEPGGFIGALVDFDGQIIERIRVDVKLAPAQGLAGETMADGEISEPTRQMRHLIRSLVTLATKRGTPCLAVGIAVPYTVHPDGRMSGTADDGEWTGLTGSDLIDTDFEIPIFVENDANALAVGELHHGVGRITPHFAVLLLARGLGAGVVTNGALYRGSRSAAGEVGYLLLGESSLTQTYPRGGDLETRLGVEALTAEARRRGLDLAATESVTVSEILSRARAGNSIAAAMSEEVLDYVARAVAAICSVLDPEYIVLGEGLDEHADFIIPALEARLDGRIFRVPTIRTAALREDAVLLGTAEMAIRSVSHFTYFAN